MVFDITTYTDPGVYTNQVLVPTGLNLSGVPFAVCLIGTGSRNKRITNEAVQRAAVTNETVTLSGTPPYTYTLANRGDRKSANTTVTRTINGISTNLPPGLFSYNAASIAGTATGPFNVTVNNAFGLQMDGLTPTTIALYPLTTDVASAITTGTSFPVVRQPLSTQSLTFTATTSVGFTVTGGGTVVTVTITGTTPLGAPQTVTIPVTTASSTTSQTGGPQAFGSITSITLSLAVVTGNISIGTTTSMSSIQGQQLSIGASLTTNGTAATRADIAAALNFGLNSASALGYGSAYASAASDNTTGIKITSPLTTPASDVRVFAAPAQDATNTLFGAAFLNAATIITVATSAVAAGATWKISYVFNSDSVLFPSAASVQSNLDSLANTNIQTVVMVGSFAGTGNFVNAVDWQLTTNQIDWSINTAAAFTGPASAPFNLGGGASLIQLSIDGLASVTLDLISAVNPPLGYSTSLSAGAVTSAQAATQINALLAQAYGPRYAGVASANGNAVVLTSPTKGRAGSITITPPTSNSAVSTIFGLSAATTVLGAGVRPANGTLYYATYDFTRLASDYNTPFQFFDASSAKAQVGQVSVNTFNYNPLAKAIEVAFLNGAQQVFLIQINDTTSPGTPTRTEFDNALAAAEKLATTTEILAVDQTGTNLANTTDVVAHVEAQSSPTNQHYRRGWFGMAINTPIGDQDTPNSFVYQSVRTLQVSPTSPGRGRYFNVAPPQQAGISRTFQLEDGSSARIQLDSTYLAVAAAALKTAQTSPAATLTRQTLNGFNVDDITAPWRRQERAALASNGNLVVTFDAGRFIMLDPVTTEAGGGGLLSFKQDSASYQKDNVTVLVNKALNQNIIGIVPFDLANFLIDIKLIIANVVSGAVAAGAIGPFRNNAGVVRPIDPRTDIRVSQSPTDQTKYYFSYWYSLRYPALRLFGEYSVDSPFFSVNSVA